MSQKKYLANGGPQSNGTKGQTFDNPTYVESTDEVISTTKTPNNKNDFVAIETGKSVSKVKVAVVIIMITIIAAGIAGIVVYFLLVAPPPMSTTEKQQGGKNIPGTKGDVGKPEPTKDYGKPTLAPPVKPSSAQNESVSVTTSTEESDGSRASRPTPSSIAPLYNKKTQPPKVLSTRPPPSEHKATPAPPRSAGPEHTTTSLQTFSTAHSTTRLPTTPYGPSGGLQTKSHPTTTLTHTMTSSTTHKATTTSVFTRESLSDGYSSTVSVADTSMILRDTKPASGEITSPSTTPSTTTVHLEISTLILSAPACGETYHLSAGEQIEITSPNYPNNYDDNLDCRWEVYTSPGTRIHVTFEDFELEVEYDDLTFSDDENPEFGLKYSGNDDPVDFTSPDSRLMIHLQTDMSTSRKGFSLIVEEQSRAEEQDVHNCTNSYILEDGDIVDIMTPLYPSNYPNDVNCKSHVTSLTNQIGIYFLDFNLEQDFDLMNISVENGRGEIVNLINQYSGNVPPPNVTVPFKNITLDFSSDEMFSERGYWIRFKAISPDITTPTITTRHTTCGEDYNIQLGDVVYLTSPNYPRKYDNNLDCLWTFSATSRALLHIHFTSFGTEQNYDFIEVGKGNGPDTGIKLLNTYSGYFTPANITTSSPNAWITFHSDDLLPDSGFEVYVTAIPDLSTTYAPTTSTLGCSEDFFLPAGEEVDISTPNFPNNYASNLDCLWTFTTVDDTQLYISFLSFNSESIYDYVEAGDGLEPHSGETLLARHSGGSTPDDIVSEGSSAWITFHSDGSMVGRGFEATIAAVQGDDFGSGVDGESSYGGEDSVQSSCVRNYQLQTGQSVKLTSPNYPSNYDSQLDCIWTFSSTDGATLHVAFDSFDTETNYDFLEAGEGSEPLDAFKIIDHHSGRYIPVDFSASPSVWIRFHSDATITSKGFEATISAFQVLDPVTTTTQTLQTFNFGPILLNRCHRDYTLGIGDVVHVTSPSYPGDYANNLDCLWTFSTNRGSRLEVRFLNFDTEFGHDYLETGEGTEKTVESVLLRRQSGHIVPNDFTTQTTSVWISFHSDNSASNKGFEFTVTAVQHIEEVEVVPTTTPTVATTTVTTTTVTPTPVGCVRSYSLQIGETIAVTSPNYPMNYDNSLNCVWTFSTVDGAHLVIRFISFQTEQAYDYLDIGEGLNHLDLSMTTLRHQSGSTAPSDITTTSPNAWITFTSDTSINSVGFEVNITAVQPMAGNDAFTTTTKPVV